MYVLDLAKDVWEKIPGEKPQKLRNPFTYVERGMLFVVGLDTSPKVGYQALALLMTHELVSCQPCFGIIQRRLSVV